MDYASSLEFRKHPLKINTNSATNRAGEISCLFVDLLFSKMSQK